MPVLRADSPISQGSHKELSEGIPSPAGEPESKTEDRMKSELKFWRWAAVIAILVLGIVGSIATAAPKSDGGGGSSGGHKGFRHGGAGVGGRHQAVSQETDRPFGPPNLVTAPASRWKSPPPRRRCLRTAVA